MACIIWQNPDGSKYRIAENQPHRPAIGAFNTGQIDWTCNDTVAFNKWEVDTQLADAGVQWGSVIKWVTSKIGMKQCSSCKAREVILNHVKEQGWAETLKQLKDTF